MLKGLKRSHALGGLVIISILLAYQNCAQAPDGTADGSSSAQDYQDSLPFAYDAKLDTLAYMSCSEVSKSPDSALMQRAYFTFRAGAYNTTTGGIGLTTAYRSQTSSYTAVERAQALGSSAFNMNTRLVFSLRLRSNLAQHWSQGDGVGLSQMAFLPPMNDAEIAGPLAASTAGRYLNYFPGAQDKRLMEASLSLLKGDTDAVLARTYLSGLGQTPLFLTAAYANSSDELESDLRQPLTYAADQFSVIPTPSTRAFGSGFNLTFTLPLNVSSGETRVLQSVSEYDLSTNPSPTLKASWSCPTSYQFMIVRPEDVQANPALCFTGADQNVSSQPGLQAAQNAIRRVLPVEDWYVDVTKNCVVPKNTGDVCYGSYGSYGASGNVFKPVYYASTCIKNNSNTASSTYGTTCPHYVSVCIR